MAGHNVTIDDSLNSVQISINTGDTIVWINLSQKLQTVSSDDGGQTFTSGPIAINSQSLPIIFSTASAGVTYVITFDLWSPADCQANWDAIKNAIANGSMPPAGPGSDGPVAARK